MNVLRVQLSAHRASSGDGNGDWRATHCLGDSPSSGPRRSCLRSEHLDPRARTTPSLLSPLIVGVYSLARPSWLTPDFRGAIASAQCRRTKSKKFLKMRS